MQGSHTRAVVAGGGGKQQKGGQHAANAGERAGRVRPQRACIPRVEPKGRLLRTAVPASRFRSPLVPPRRAGAALERAPSRRERSRPAWRRMASSKPTLEEAVSILLQNPHGGGAARSNQPQALSITQPLSMTSHPSAPAVVFTLATETLFKVVQNLVAHPENPAFRVLKRSSNAFSTKLAPAMGAVRFLRAIGFVEEGTSGCLLYTSPSPRD